MNSDVLPAWCVHTGWRGHGRPFHPEQLSLRAMMGVMWLFGRTLKHHWVRVWRCGFHQYVKKLRIISMGRTPWVHTVLKVVAISRKTVPVSCVWSYINMSGVRLWPCQLGRCQRNGSTKLHPKQHVLGPMYWIWIPIIILYDAGLQ